jgi:hypothetical protein
VQKSKLGASLVITLAMLVGVFYFSGSNPLLNSGQAITLCLGALAWIGLISNSDPQSPHLNPLDISQTTNSESLPNSVVALLNTFQAELSQQISATEAELTQVKSLMDNAIDDLVDSFISLEANTRIGQNLLKQMASSETDKKDDLNPFKDKQLQSQKLLQDTSDILKKLLKDAKQNQSTCTTLANSSLGINSENSKALAKLLLSGDLLLSNAKLAAGKVSAVIEENQSHMVMVANEIVTTTTQIEKDVQTAVKSLQFQDMTSQLIAQCSERMHIMQEMLQATSAIDNKASHSSEVLLAKLMVARNKLKQASTVRMKQFNVDAGSVELFN